MGARGPDEHEDAPAFDLTLPARAENVAVVRHAVGGLGEALDVPDSVLSDMKLAVTEACTNVVVHAYPDAADAGPMILAGRTNGGTLTLVVTDQGCGMVPRPDSPGLGLGLPLIATLTSSLEIGSKGAGSELRMTFDLHGSRENRS
ncbi:MAG TPA: ATP-binding protein [Baekduia sp.]|nr:ATP-binding protein [Baekduia sp.]